MYIYMYVQGTPGSVAQGLGSKACPSICVYNFWKIVSQRLQNKAKSMATQHCGCVSTRV